MITGIQLKNVSFAYPQVGDEKEKVAVKDVSLTIEKGSFVVVLGHNGSGKSTMAKLLNAVYLPTSGEVLVDGISTRDEKQLLFIRQKVGMVFQNPDNQIVANVVEEDVAFAPENLGVPSEEIRQRVDSALKDVNLSEFATHAPHLLSGGQKQRLAIAGVIAMSPDYVVLDEATAMLDPVGRNEVLATIHKLNKERGMTVILITHHMNEAADADRVIVMNDGSLVMDGTPLDVFTRVEELRDMGLNVPDTVALADALQKEGFSLKIQLDVDSCVDEILQSLGKKSNIG